MHAAYRASMFNVQANASKVEEECACCMLIERGIPVKTSFLAQPATVLIIALLTRKGEKSEKPEKLLMMRNTIIQLGSLVLKKKESQDGLAIL